MVLHVAGAKIGRVQAIVKYAARRYGHHEL
jgi:hypothetical protein